jgi:hypothetical protein
MGVVQAWDQGEWKVPQEAGVKWACLAGKTTKGACGKEAMQGKTWVAVSLGMVVKWEEWVLEGTGKGVLRKESGAPNADGGRSEVERGVRNGRGVRGIEQEIGRATVSNEESAVNERKRRTGTDQRGRLHEVRGRKMTIGFVQGKMIMGSVVAW